MFQYTHAIKPEIPHREKPVSNKELYETLATWAAARAGSLTDLIDPLERVIIAITFQRYRYNITKTAMALGIDRTTLRTKLRHHKLIQW